MKQFEKRLSQIEQRIERLSKFNFTDSQIDKRDMIITLEVISDADLKMFREALEKDEITGHTFYFELRKKYSKEIKDYVLTQERYDFFMNELQKKKQEVLLNEN